MKAFVPGSTRLLAAIPALLLGIIVAAFAVACGGDSNAADLPTPLPTAIDVPDNNDPSGDFAGPRPPDLTVTDGNTSVVAGLGTFCFANLCVDTIGYITPADALVLDGNTLSAMLSSESIAELFVSVTPAEDLASQPVCTVVDGIEPTGPICEAEQDQIAWTWTGSSGEGVDLVASAEGANIDVDVSSLEPGSYVVSFFVRFEVGGDASYGVLLDVA